MSPKAALLVLGLAWAGVLPAFETLRLPWVFSDAPDLSADFGFEPGDKGATKVSLDLGGRFAGFGLPGSSPRAPRLQISAEITAPSELERDVRTLGTTVDLAEVLSEYGLTFERRHFDAGSSLVYKASLSTQLAPGDYNVGVEISDLPLGIKSRRTLHLLVPAMDAGRWQLGDLRFITAVGAELDAHGREQRLLDPNPWRQVGGPQAWDLLVAYSDLGPRPKGPLTRSLRIRRLRGDGTPLWEDLSPPAAKKASQVWLLKKHPDEFKDWKAGVYVLDVELKAGGQTAKASKTFELLP